ncbi:IS200/IS605 family transposase [Bremerella cremea]|uniref:IS200/IS605 family transposase n=1 Tax=Bremerella cremea TaxID=1031537 RepID=A0A368KQR8_9BACT|nr:IS200/IS605 family transposase [Bremerella cremea]RCS49228.1 IS200/IS605 family transposase [Bremerella cremea]
MPQSFACLYVHLIFSTKGRMDWIGEDWERDLAKYFAGVLRNQGYKLIESGGTANHVHLLFSMARQTNISNLVRDLKSNSSSWVHREFHALKEFAWQAGYAAFSVSYSALDDVKRYIENQKEHHRTRTFQEEFLSFLEKHHIEYDPKYVFE